MAMNDDRDELIAALADSKPGHRHQALIALGACAVDPLIGVAIRPLLASDDVIEAGLAATGLARQGDITDLPAVLDLVRRFSPAEGGTTEAMLVPLQAALDLAAQAGPDAVAGGKSRARGWRGEPTRRRRQWGGQLDDSLDALLAE